MKSPSLLPKSDAHSTKESGCEEYPVVKGSIDCLLLTATVTRKVLITMPTMTNKQQQIEQIIKVLKKRYDTSGEVENRPVLEHLLYAIIREGTTRQQADRAFKNLRTVFFDWNEVRVSAPHEIEEILEDIPCAGERAQRIIGVLQYWFELKFNFDMEDLAKKGLKDAARQLSRMLSEVAKNGMKEAGRVPSRIVDGNDYVVATVIQQGLGGHAVPIDTPSLRVLRRLQLIEPEVEDLESIRGSIEHCIPKSKTALFNELVSRVAAELCFEQTPKCKSCVLRPDCPASIEMLARPEPKLRKSR
jgi:endonuclease III